MRKIVLIATLLFAGAVLTPATGTSTTIPVWKVKITRMNDQNFCSLLTGTYCGEIPPVEVTTQMLHEEFYDPSYYPWRS